MKIKVLWIGKTKEKFISEGISHYLKLLKKHLNLQIVEIKECKSKSKEEIIQKESKLILSQTSWYILLDEKGFLMSSEEFANFLSRYEQVDFVIGGPFGVSEEVKKKAKFNLSLSKMTFTHEMARLILLEQLFRASTIIKGVSYHY
ncbi:MAG: 23S rRNA (pseudouridine(1915)-N(3))-methyltransferase RlmH [Thermodesulfovibrionales bacterium]|nr:23S rRNA (pseudouridine(1915)-N(3))-methyltransferase RlmH [Thermodesulfovibrionales bacterium]